MNEHINEALQKLENKTFADRFRAIKTASPWFSWAFTLLSVGTALGFALEVALPLFKNIYLAGAAALACLLFIEFLERLAAFEVSQKHYATKAESPAFIGQAGFLRWAAFVVLSAISLSLSGVGSYYSYKRIADTENTVKTVYTLKSDSVKNAMDAEITALDSAKTAYFNQNKWKGVLKNNAATEQFNKMSDELRELKRQKAATLAAIQKEEFKSLFDGTNKTEYNAIWGAVWVVALSFGKLFFIFFPCYFWFRELKDAGFLPLEKKTARQKEKETVLTTVLEALAEPVEEPKKPALTVSRACVNCGSKDKMQGKRVTAKFCSDGCKNEHHNHKAS